jgi:energy-coupling factor transporter ATP-binding protein EcfA2
MHYPQYQRCVAVLLLFSLLLQSCRSGLHAVIEESNPPIRHDIGSCGQDPSSALVIASGILPGILPATGADTHHRVLASASLVGPSASQPPPSVLAAAVPASLQQHPGSVSTRSPSLSPTSASAVTPTTPLSGLFTTSSGDRVLLRQLLGEWQALLHQGVKGYARGRILPVVSSGDIGASLETLQGQDAWSSRSRIHVLATPTPPYSPCVYLGKIGLLGGMPGVASDEEAKLAVGHSLLARKLADPECVLSESESIALLTFCVARGVEHAKKVKDKEAVIVIGTTGAGKSTFVNYLLGCTMAEKSPEGDTFENVVAVQPRSEGGLCDEVMPIGHGGTSKTYMPQVASVPDASSLSYCDCPVFLDNRGAEINIVNAVNIKHVLHSAKCVKVVILIDYHTIKPNRGHGLKETMKLCTQLFGSDATPESFQNAVLLGVTRAPENISSDVLGHMLLKQDPSSIMQALSKRVFLYDPLDRGGADFWSRDQCASHLAALKGIPQSQSCNMFQTVLTADDEKKLIDIVEKQSRALREELDRGAYTEASSCWQALQHLKVVNDVRVDRPLQLAQIQLRDVASRRVNLFMECLLRDDLEEAENHLSSLSAMSEEFDAKEDLGLDLDKLEALLLTRLPQVFGAKAWKQYFGEVGEEPSLPADIGTILGSPCPFWPDKRVKDTHLLVLVPATVDGKPFTLDLLGDLIKSPQGFGSKTKYREYDSDVQKELGAKSPGRSYWVLMTRDVLPGSRDKTYDAQEVLVATHVRETGLSYKIPDVLEAATAILSHHAHTGECLYTNDPSTYTRCQNRVGSNNYPVFVGDFSPGGLGVDRNHSVYDFVGGVSCLRKF